MNSVSVIFYIPGSHAIRTFLCQVFVGWRASLGHCFRKQRRCTTRENDEDQAVPSFTLVCQVSFSLQIPLGPFIFDAKQELSMHLSENTSSQNSTNLSWSLRLVK